MQTYAGIDLHSSNNYIGVIDANDKRLYSKRLDNNLKQVIKTIRPFRKSIQGIASESTFNSHWLVDGLQEHGFKVHLVNPAAIQVYSGLKHTYDKWDSFWLAPMLLLGICGGGKPCDQSLSQSARIFSTQNVKDQTGCCHQGLGQ